MTLTGCNDAAIICQCLPKLSNLPPDSCSRTLICFINLKNLNILHARSLGGTLGLCYLPPTLPKLWLAVLKASSAHRAAEQLGTRLQWEETWEKQLWTALPEACPCFAWGCTTLCPRLSHAAGVPMPAQAPHWSWPAHLTLDLPCHCGLIRLLCWLNLTAVTLPLLFHSCRTAPACPAALSSPPACPHRAAHTLEAWPAGNPHPHRTEKLSGAKACQAAQHSPPTTARFQCWVPWGASHWLCLVYLSTI